MEKMCEMKKQIIHTGILVSTAAMMGLWLWQSHKQESKAFEEITTVGGEEIDTFLPIIFQPSTTFYVSKLGNNSDGLSWGTAWNELDQIDWNLMQPGGTIYIDGGNSTMTYSTTMLPEASGEVGKPIRIRLSEEPSRNGQAIIFGGRSTPLPYCDQVSYSPGSGTFRNYAILFDDVSWLEIDGTKWRGIVIYGHNNNGIRFHSDSSYITIRNVEIYDNGYAEFENGAWQPNSAGIRIAGHHQTFERVIVHDNGQDAFQSGAGPSPNFNVNNLDNLTIRESWLYNGRTHPTVPESYNYCTHTDGLQINRGGDVSDILIEDSIVGPGLTNALLLGQALTSNGAEALVNNVTLRNTLFAKAADNTIKSYTDTEPENWVLDGVTAHCATTKFQCLSLAGDNHTVINTIIHSSLITLPDGLDTFSNNCQWNTDGFVLGLVADPLFTSVSNSDPFSLDDYTLASGSPCAGMGTTIESVNELLSLP
jgi:hypothetical protein